MFKKKLNSIKMFWKILHIFEYHTYTVHHLYVHRLNVDRSGGGWCPKPPVEQGVREWLQVDFPTVHMITGVQTQGRFGRGRGLEYAEEYTLEYWRPGLAEWKPYKRWDGKQVSSILQVMPS